MQRRYWRDQRGVTLIELMITMGLLSAFLVLLTTIFTSSIDVQSQTGSYAAVTSDGRFVLARLAYDIRRASAIGVPAGLGDTGSSLTLTIDGSTYIYAVQDGRLAVAVDGDSDYLTGQDATVSGLNFQKLGTSEDESVRYSFTLTANAGHHDDSQTYTSTTERR